MAVAEELHFARAAERLHIEQSPLSRTIKELESDIGAQLFDRNSRGTRLTKPGEALAEAAKRIFQAVEQARCNVQAAAAGYCGSLRIALSDGVLPQRLAAVLARCREEEPEVEIRLFEVKLSQQLKGLREDLFDVGFACSKIVGEGLTAQAVWQTPLTVAVPARHPLLSLKEIPLATVLNYPTCRQWWSDAGHGLRSRLLQQVDANLLTRLSKWAGFLSKTQADDSVIRSIVSPRQQALNQGQVYASYGGQIDMTASNITARAASDLGLTAGSLGFFPAMDVVRQALPMVLSFLKMALTICIPLILVIGTYDLKALMTISCVQFALFFVDFWFQLARWIDSTILDALYGWNSPHSNFNVLMGLNNSFGDMLLNFVMATMFLILPTFWIGSLTWVGINAGNALRGLSDATNDAKNAGRTGGDLAMKTMK
jgi:DNA-binding transcriptional LysR family regulator